jgi:putative DNA primase/helicase
MTRQEAIAEILRIVDGAIAPASPVITEPASESTPSQNNGARRKPRGRSSSSPSALLPASSSSSLPAVAAAAPGAAAVDPAASQAPNLSRSSSSFSVRPSAPAGQEKKTSSQMGRWPADYAMGEGGERDEDPQTLNRRLGFFPCTDLGNVDRFVQRQRGRLMWCRALGWLCWDGRRWNQDGAEEVVRRAEHETVRAIQFEAKALAAELKELLDAAGMPPAKPTKKKAAPKKKSGKAKVVKPDPAAPDVDDKTLARIEALKDMPKKLAGWGRQSEANSKLVPIAKHAAAYLSVQPDQLDADPFKINVNNGTLIVDRDIAGYIVFRPHDPADLMTKISPVDYDAAALCPQFDKFFGEVQGKPENRRLLLAWMGYSLTSDTTEQKLCMFYGKGQNGKSVFVDLCCHVAGDYAETVPIETFLNEGRGRNAGQATPDLAILPSVRMLRTSEPEKGAKLSEALIKLATGGEPIIARHLNRDYFKFYPHFKLTISGNYRPQILGTDEGIWRRMVLVPWTYRVPDDKKDVHLVGKLRQEASGVLNRLLDGLRDWLDHGLVLSADVDAATKEYRRDSDPLGRFLQACVVDAPGERVQSSELHKLFNAWGTANGASVWSGKGFSNAMTERGFQKKQSDVMWWLDIKTTKLVSDFVDDDGKSKRQRGDGEPDADPKARGGGTDDDRFDG